MNEGKNVNDGADWTLERRKKRRRLLTMLLIVAGTIMLLPVAYLGYLTTTYFIQFKTGEIVSPEERRLQASLSRLSAKADVKTEDIERVIAVTLAPELGNRDAEVTVVEFIDYLCPFCEENAPDIRRVMTGMGSQVRFLIRDFPIVELHPNAREAALAANCILEQGQEPYWRYHDMIFADQAQSTPELLRIIAERTNIDMEQYDECIGERRYDRKIDEDIEVGLGAGVAGTPTFFVNGVKFQGVMDEETLTRTLNFFLENVPK